MSDERWRGPPKTVVLPLNLHLDKFYRDGLEFIQTTKKTAGRDPCFAIKPGMRQWRRWSAYFLDVCQEYPPMMRMVVDGAAPSMTVPAEEPRWFDQLWEPREATGPVQARDRDFTDAEREKGLARVRDLMRGLSRAKAESHLSSPPNGREETAA